MFNKYQSENGLEIFKEKILLNNKIKIHDKDKIQQDTNGYKNHR